MLSPRSLTRLAFYDVAKSCSMLGLTLRYSRGEGVTQSFKKAFKWNEKAALQDDVAGRVIENNHVTDVEYPHPLL